MPDFSKLISATHHNISSGFLETLIQTRREELFTGLMRLNYETGENFMFSFVEGIQQRLYRPHENTVDILPQRTWSNIVDHRNATVGLLHLSVEGMRFARIVHESPVLRTEKLTIESEELAEAVAKWSLDTDASVLFVQSEPVNKYYLIAGHSNPVIEELSFVRDEANFSLSDASFPRMLPKAGAGYQVARYVCNSEHAVWREHELRLAFNPLIRMLLTRFSELGGRVLTERMCERLSLWAHQGGYNITVTSNGVVNKQYFDSLDNAIGNYVDILRQFRKEAIPAIGSRMVETISRETLNKFDPYRRELLSQHIYSQPGVGSLTGVVWR